MALEASAEERETRGIHFNDHHAPVLRINGKLYVRPSGFNPDFPDQTYGRSHAYADIPHHSRFAPVRL